MRQKNRQRARRLVKLICPEDYERLHSIKIHDLGFGYDPFGLEMESAMVGFSVAKLLYKYWFRVESEGWENVPLEGPVLITPNHSGVLPIDGAMMGLDLVMKLEKPRMMRAVVDNMAGFVPYFNTFLYRAGQVVGARRNFEWLLRNGEMVAVFPEGAKGTGKPYKERYKLRRFNVGFMELSLKHKAPIVPSAVIGAEEQYPYWVNFAPLARMFKFPYFPVAPLMLLLGPLGALPLPTKYHIYYGEPFHFYREYPPETVQDPGTVRKLVGMVQDSVEALVQRGLNERKGVLGLNKMPGWMGGEKADTPLLQGRKNPISKGQ